jgi:hypothetical protein
MYCVKCDKEILGGSICHLCGGPLAASRDAAQLSPSKKPLTIITRKKFKIGKEFGQTLPGRLGRLAIEIALFCALFVVVSLAVVAVANWLSKEMALPGELAKFVDIHSRWMKYFWYIGCGAIVFLTIKLRFRPGK